jgi:hypothetical protein
MQLDSGRALVAFNPFVSTVLTETSEKELGLHLVPN